MDGTGRARQTAIGWLPTPEALDLNGLRISPEDVNELLSVDVPGWKNEIADVAANYRKLDSHLPAALSQELEALDQRLSAAR